MAQKFIIRDTAGRHFSVRDSGVADLAHVWIGVEMKMTTFGWAPKAKAREILVRKAGCTIIEERR